MAKPLFIILLLLPSLALVGSDFERVVHYEVDRNSKTVTLWHEEKSSETCSITLDSEVVGPIELLERERWVLHYGGEPDSIHGWFG